ncbi:MAG: GAF domain-containing protein [Flavobacteriales bacterium]|nr:GAF domain-containing protein [Flavobacteriales bacterium]
MKVIQANDLNKLELPLQFSISFHKVFSMYEKYASAEFEKHPFHNSAKIMLKEMADVPELIEGFSDFKLLEKHQEKIELLLKPLFPESLLLNEIKAASIPFSFTSFMFTTRFEDIINDAGKDFKLRIRNFDDDLFYIHACIMILSSVYNYSIDLKRPFFFDIPDKNGEIKNYRVAFNGDLGEIIPTKNAPKITEDDIEILLDSFDNIEIWKEKFPVGSYIFKGFGIVNLFDVTTDEIISEIRNDLLRGDENLTADLEKNLRRFYNIEDLRLGFSVFEVMPDGLIGKKMKKSESLILDADTESSCGSFFCNGVINKVFNEGESIAISDVEKYGKNTKQNPFYLKLKEKNIGSIMLIPIPSKNKDSLAVLEITSPRPFELNSINKYKLLDILPVFASAVDRASKEHQNLLAATIQEHYTSIHSSVKWRFDEAAEKYHYDLSNNNGEKVKLDQIVFENVYPLFGQCDIKGSSIARNKAIRADLTLQLELAIDVLKEALKSEKLPIYDELMFRITTYFNNISRGLKAGDEVEILDFLKRDIYPVFNHIKDINEDLSKVIDIYESRLDKDLHAVYEKRKDYENSVTLLNDKLASYLDEKQEEAQQMFPHYFERYKTDGVEHNMYIGQSLVKKGKFENLYLYNLRLWQLQLMVEMENVAYRAKLEMENPLSIASLILVHSNSLAIKFRMDEKQFDVDGAYNIRYEIIKKRIDKAHINGTDERLTVPGKIAIVYSQEKDAIEYIKYIRFLQSKNLFGKLEKLELEDLQGVSGLKALRVEVIYQDKEEERSTLTYDELIKEIQS